MQPQQPWQRSVEQNGIFYGFCPFDQNHKVKLEKMRFHINRCKAPIKEQYRQCPNHELHWVHKLALEEHSKTCTHQPIIYNQSGDESILERNCHIQNSDKKAGNNSELQRGPFAEFQGQVQKDPQEIANIEIDFSIDQIKEKVQNSSTVPTFGQKRQVQFKENLWKQPNFTQWLKLQQHGQGVPSSCSFHTSHMLSLDQIFQ